MDFITRKIFSNLVDVFWGEGFDNWARIRWIKDRWIITKTNKTPPKELSTFLKTLAKE